MRTEKKMRKPHHYQGALLVDQAKLIMECTVPVVVRSFSMSGVINSHETALICFSTLLLRLLMGPPFLYSSLYLVLSFMFFCTPFYFPIPIYIYLFGVHTEVQLFDPTFFFFLVICSTQPCIVDEIINYNFYEKKIEDIDY